jgi:hypothetical protein
MSDFNEDRRKKIDVALSIKAFFLSVLFLLFGLAVDVPKQIHMHGGGPH